MNRRSISLGRRHFLRAAGVCIALPALNSLLPRRARAELGQNPQRLVVIGHPNGTTQMPDQVDPPDGLRARLAPVEGRYTIVKNINNQDIKHPQQQTGIGTAHSACFHGFLNGETHHSIGEERKTFDQMLAEDSRHQGLRVDSVAINCWNRDNSQNGVPQQWFNTWGWKGPGQPVAPYRDPRELFELLFAGFEPEEDPIERARLERKQLYLDAVLEQIHAIEPKLNSTDRHRLDEYLTGVEELDRKTSALLDGGGAYSCMIPGGPSIDLPGESVLTPSDLYPQVISLMQDLVVLALQCDATRVITFMHASPASGSSLVPHSFVGGFEGSVNTWHPLSHWSSPYGSLSPDESLNRRDYERLLGWHYDRVVEFVQKLEGVQGTDGRSLLDDTLVTWGSWQAGAVHRVNNLYQILFGSGGGVFKEGVEISANPGNDNGPKNIADLWLTVMRGFGLEADSLGRGQDGVDELLV